jgi:tetratricopeptide (TPR) repeat protein
MQVTPETRKVVEQEMASFLSDIGQTDRKLISQKEKQSEIFESGVNNKENKSVNLGGQIEQFERKKMAENERLKGNEYMKSKEFQDAIKSYSKSLELFSEDAATYSNRALAYLKTKEFTRALEDAESAIKLKEDYIKAYHRRGKAYASLNKLELAIRDFQFILEKEPNNKEAMQEVKNARKKLDDKLDSVKPNTSEHASKPAAPAKQNKFVRVAIQEESDEDEEETPQIQGSSSGDKPSTFNVEKSEPGTTKEEEPQKAEVSSTPAIEVLESKENPTWWKKSSDNLDYDDFNVPSSKPADEEIVIPKKEKFEREAEAIRAKEAEAKAKAQEADIAAQKLQEKIDEQSRKKAEVEAQLAAA